MWEYRGKGMCGGNQAPKRAWRLANQSRPCSSSAKCARAGVLEQIQTTRQEGENSTLGNATKTVHLQSWKDCTSNHIIRCMYKLQSHDRSALLASTDWFQKQGIRQVCCHAHRFVARACTASHQALIQFVPWCILFIYLYNLCVCTCILTCIYMYIYL